MTKRVAVALLPLLLLGAQLLFAENEQKVIPLSSQIYPALQSLYLSQGLAPPFGAKPYTVAEASEALKRLDRAKLSEAGKRAYDYVQTHLRHHSLVHANPQVAFDLRPRIQLGAYLQSNPGAQADSSEPNWVKRPSVLTLPFELWLGSIFYADIEAPLKQDPFVAQLPPGFGEPSGFHGNPTNIPLAASQIYAEVPYRAFISLGGSHWNVVFGRDTADWGNGPFGNLLLADNTDYYDLLHATTFWRNFKLTADYIGLPPYYPGSGGSSLLTSGVANKGPLMSKLLLSHRLDIRIRKRITFALSEAMVLGGLGAPLDYLNPLMIYHNYNIWNVANDIASVELTVNPYRWFELFGQFAMNQVGGSVEPYSGAKNTPTAFGYIAGAKLSYPLGPGYLVAAGQWTRTDPWLYIGGRPSLGPLPWLTLDADRRYLSNFLNADPTVTVPLGWRYGPDSLVWDASVAYSAYGRYRAGIALRLQQQGSVTITTPHAYGPQAVALATPSGPNPVKTRVVRLFGSYHIGRLFGIDTTVGGDLSFIDVANVDHTAGANSFNVQFVARARLSL